jgi:YD repeat-containing protein
MVSSQNLMAGTPDSGRTYTYDADGRLVKVVISNGDTTTTVAYTYDQAGNLVGVSKS